jgi:alkylation response protein AidB-like acyl-CoA dehydrogenase
MQLLDRADKETDAAFVDDRYKVTSGAVHRAVWPKSKPYRRSKFAPVNLFRELQSSLREIRSKYIPWELFEPSTAEQGAETVLRPHLEVVRDRTIQIIQEREAQGTLWDPVTGKITKDVEKDLGAAGYFGLLIEQKYGGQGATFAEFFAILTAVAAKVDATFEGLASIHGCIGATRPLNKFGTPDQKAKFLPPLGDGTLLSFFGATERDAGTAIVNQKTVAVLDGDDYVINGAKMFISNAKEGRLGVIICKIDGKISALIAHLPETQNEHFQINRYKIDVLKHIENVELIFKDFRVPKENLLGRVGDGMKVAYDGLNFGRLAVLAGAAGISRRVLKLMVDWCQYRHSFGAPLSERQLPQARISRVASLIVAMDGLRRTCASRLDEGYRCEHECIQAKVLGSWWLKEIVIDNAMTTQGGRSFLHGNLI